MHYEKYDFLLPLWGAMTVSEYWHVNMDRLGLLPNVNFGIDMTMNNDVTAMSCFMVNHQYLPQPKWQRCSKKAFTKFSCRDAEIAVNGLGAIGAIS